MTRKRALLILTVAVLLAATGAATRALFVTSATLVVNGNGDLDDHTPGDGHCDALSTIPGDQCGLRAAIQELNAQGAAATPHRIEFNIAGTGPFTITPGSALPLIQVPVEINGATQAGAVCPSHGAPAGLMIVLDGSHAGPGAAGLYLAAGSEGSIVRGLVIGRFDGSGLNLNSGANKVRCNHIGLGSDGISPLGNHGSGISSNSDANTIGGLTAHAQRNVIAGNGRHGIRLEPTAAGNLIAGNFVGTTADGMSGMGNSSGGIYVAGNGNVIGSASSPAPNVVAANNGYGIVINDADANVVQANVVGAARDGITPLGNLGPGVQIMEASAGNLVGGPGGNGNRIVFNQAAGVLVKSPFGGTPTQNAIRQNAIFANGGLGIDLGDDGPDSNDPGDGDLGENERQNYPVLTTNPGSFLVQGAIDGHAFTSYDIDVYRSDSCDATGFGQGQQFLTSVVVATGGSGQQAFLVDLAGLVSDGNALTATATDPLGNTSEFSACATMSAPWTPTPTSTGTTAPPTGTPTSTPTPSGTVTPTAGPSPTPTGTVVAGPSPTAPPGPSPTPTATGQPDGQRVYLPLVLR